MYRNGIILVNKNVNTKSFSIISELRKILGVKKIGHTGTIDKDQSGLLVCLINDATKQVDYLQNFKKEYIIELILGIETDTEDIYGNIINKNTKVDIDLDRLKEVLKNFTKEYLQTPPMYSAKKVNGKRLLQFAHENVEIERKQTKVNIYSIDILNYDQIHKELSDYNAKYFVPTDISVIENAHNIKLQKFYLKVSCSKGTYMRTLCKDIGKELSVYATMGSLVRIKNANFSLSEADDIDTIAHKFNDKDYSFIKPCYYMPTIQIVSFGKFETIHLGHQKIFKKMNELAKENSLSTTVLLIEEDNNKEKVFSKEQRYTFIKNCGIDNIKTLTLYDDIKKWTGEYFVNEILINQLNAEVIVVGEDCSFGYMGSSKINDLKALCEKHNVKVIDIEKIKISDIYDRISNNQYLLAHKDEYISSTFINTCFKDKNYNAIELLTNRAFRNRD